MSKPLVDVKLDPKSQKEFNTAITQLSKLNGKPVEEILRQQGRLFAMSAARATRRRGRTKNVKIKHEEDIDKYVRSIYLDPEIVAKRISKKMGTGAGRRFWGYKRSGNIGKAQDLLNAANIYNGRVEVSRWDNGNLHQEQRNKKRPTMRKVIFNFSEVPRYIKKEGLRIGYMKAGWGAAALQLGGNSGENKIPAYVMRHAKKEPTLGTGKVTGRGHKAVLTVSNNLDYMTDDGVFGSGKLWLSRIKAMQKLIETMINRKGRKITRKLNRLT